MGLRRRAREAALQTLFMSDYCKDELEESIELTFTHFKTDDPCLEYAKVICEGVLKNLEEIDQKIICASSNWNISRMNSVDRWIIRISTFEMLFLEGVPFNVAINEAIEVAKVFSSEESSVFVNGVLDSIADRSGLKARKLEKDLVAKKSDEPKPRKAA